MLAATADFHALGLGKPLAISAEHGEHISDLMDLVLAEFPESRARAGGCGQASKIAIVGRPNVGSQRWSMRCSAEERVVVFDSRGRRAIPSIISSNGPANAIR